MGITGNAEREPVVPLVVLETDPRHHVPVPFVLAGDAFHAETLGEGFVLDPDHLAAEGNPTARSERVLGGQAIRLFQIGRAAYGGIIVVPAGRVESVANGISTIPG